MRDFIAYQIAMQAARSLGGCLAAILKKDRDLDRLLAVCWRLTERGVGGQGGGATVIRSGWPPEVVGHLGFLPLLFLPRLLGMIRGEEVRIVLGLLHSMIRRINAGATSRRCLSETGLSLK